MAKRHIFQDGKAILSASVSERHLEIFREEAERLLLDYEGAVRLTGEELTDRLSEVGGTLKAFSRMFSSRGTT